MLGKAAVMCGRTDTFLCDRCDAYNGQRRADLYTLTRIAFGFRSPEALIALAMLSLGGHPPVLPART